MIFLKTQEEIELMRESALMVSRALGIVAREVKPGVTPLFLDQLAEQFIRDNGGVPAFKGYKSGSGGPGPAPSFARRDHRLRTSPCTP